MRLPCVPNLSAAYVHKLSRCTVHTIVSDREEDQFNRFWDDTLSEASILEVDNSKLHRKRNPPKKLNNVLTEFYDTNLPTLTLYLEKFAEDCTKLITKDIQSLTEHLRDLNW